MTATAPSLPDLPSVLAHAEGALRAGDPGGAEQALVPLLHAHGGDPRLLHMMGLVKMHSRAFAEAATFFGRARAADPRASALAFSHGTALRWAERGAEAVDAFREAIRLKPDHAEAYFEAGTTLQQMGKLEEAGAVFSAWLASMPGDARGVLALADLLLESDKLQEAEQVLRPGIANPAAAPLHAVMLQRLGFILRRQGREEEALEALTRSATLDPVIFTDAVRAELLQALHRHDEALAISRDLIRREPENPDWHKFHNELLYRLRHPDYLKSYDGVPETAALLLSKAFFLSHEKRAEEALDAYNRAVALEPDNRQAAAGAASALSVLGRHGEALAAFDRLLTTNRDSPELYGCAAEAALLSGDPQKAAHFCDQTLKLAPHDQTALCILSTAWRLMEDERDETLSGYDSLIRSFELEPPEGFSSMDDFNAELNSWLDRVHPATREYLNQSLRGGTQTPDQLFGKGHMLVEKLRGRIDEAIHRYIREMKDDGQHPFLSRRAGGFRHVGSWSSRLRDCGFHINHIHPQGWISSCYYVAVPKAVEDVRARQGWIKFGEPGLDVPLENAIRRAIQPRAGRLVLFPSYMWHGTIPFHDAQPRTTIAFDIVPQA
jgi:tetratricopeptide (TPR) repeat protein